MTNNARIRIENFFTMTLFGQNTLRSSDCAIVGAARVSTNFALSALLIIATTNIEDGCLQSNQMGAVWTMVVSPTDIRMAFPLCICRVTKWLSCTRAALEIALRLSSA